MNYYYEDLKFRIKSNLIIGFILLIAGGYTQLSHIQVFKKPLYLWVFISWPFVIALSQYLGHLYNKRNEKAYKKAQTLVNDERLRLLKYREESFTYYLMTSVTGLFFLGFYLYLGAEGIGNIFWHLWIFYAIVLLTVHRFAKNHVNKILQITKDE